MRRLDVSAPQRTGLPRAGGYPPELFCRITDILADLALEDLKQFPQIPTDPCIDRTRGPENTVPLAEVGNA